MEEDDVCGGACITYGRSEEPIQNILPKSQKI
jgi:hypothetical protein